MKTQSENCLRLLFLVCIVVNLGNYAYYSVIPGGTLDEYGNIVQDDDDDDEGEVFGPTSALLGTLAGGPLKWGDSVTENPMVGDTEIWEINNFTEDAHPIHVHLIMFQVLGRGPEGTAPPKPWEMGWKDTVIAYPEEITRIKARFDIAGLNIWHCHILEHEDNEMMRPYRVEP